MDTSERSPANARIIKAPHGTTLTAKSWLTEAPMRMIMNNLDPEVAEKPDELIVYGGIGKAARNWECFDRIVETLKNLSEDETLLVQSGKPVGVFKTHPDAPRVLIANSNLVPHWATWEYFRELDRKGLMMYGQMTAGSWIYIGSQGIVQGTYETFVEMGRQHFGGDLSGKWILTAGLGGMGGAQPLASTMAGASMLAVEVDQQHIQRRLDTGYCDTIASTLDEALDQIREAINLRQPLSIGLLGNAADIYPELVRRGIKPDMVTDQTSAHDVLNGYIPAGLSLAEAAELRQRDPEGYVERAKESIAKQVRAMLEFYHQGIPVVDYGNNLRQVAYEAGVTNAFDYPGFVPAYIRPLFCRGIGPFRWVALSGDPEDIYKTDAKVKELIPDNPHLHRWLDMARQKIHFQGLPARICWVGLGERARLGLAFNEMVTKGELSAPIVIGRDHLDSQSRNRRDERRLRRGFGLAGTQCSAQLREWCDLGKFPSWRRGRHGLLTACRAGDRGGRHTGGCKTPGARAHQRPRLRRHAPCRRRLRRSHRVREGKRPQAADDFLSCDLPRYLSAEDNIRVLGPLW